MLNINITEPEMWKINMIVVPLIMTSWENVAYSLRYRIEEVEAIKLKYKEDPEKCCKELFVNWLSTHNGICPKTWKTLLNALKTGVFGLTAATEKIEFLLPKDNITPEDLL